MAEGVVLMERTRGKYEIAVSLFFGALILYVIFSTGFISEVLNAFGMFGALGRVFGILVVIFILMILWGVFNGR